MIPLEILWKIFSSRVGVAAAAGLACFVWGHHAASVSWKAREEAAEFSRRAALFRRQLEVNVAEQLAQAHLRTIEADKATLSERIKELENASHRNDTVRCLDADSVRRLQSITGRRPHPGR